MMGHGELLLAWGWLLRAAADRHLSADQRQRTAQQQSAWVLGTECESRAESKLVTH